MTGAGDEADKVFGQVFVGTKRESLHLWAQAAEGTAIKRYKEGIQGDVKDRNRRNKLNIYSPPPTPPLSKIQYSLGIGEVVSEFFTDAPFFICRQMTKDLVCLKSSAAGGVLVRVAALDLADRLLPR